MLGPQSKGDQMSGADSEFKQNSAAVSKFLGGDRHLTEREQVSALSLYPSSPSSHSDDPLRPLITWEEKLGATKDT